MIDLDELKALRAKMTPTPWDWSRTALEPDSLAWSIQPGVLIADGNDGTPGGDEIDRANALGIVALVNAAEPMLDEIERMREALIRLRDCDWVISLPDRMDAVREIARAALGEQP